MRKLIGIGGGIGSGKSVVARICRLKGFNVYDCDLRARLLMTCDFKLKNEISNLLGKDAFFADGRLNRKLISESIFRDEGKRKALNRLVHKAVRDDILVWSSNSKDKILFVESALIFTAGLDKILDEIWIVEAPYNHRFNRILERDNISEEDARLRMESQKKEEIDIKSEDCIILKNNGEDSLFCQIMERINLITDN